MLRVAIAGGGTGGHLFPGVALAEELESRADAQILFLGSEEGLDAKVIPEGRWRMELLSSPRLRLAPSEIFKSLRGLWRAYRQSRRIFDSWRPDVVVGLGGFAAAMPVVAAWRIRVPVLLMEQNVLPGRTTRHLARFAAEIDCQFEESLRYLRGHKAAVTGNPIRRAIREAALGRRDLSHGVKGKTLLVIGGSQGAKRLNELVLEALPHLAGVGRILHVAGERDYGWVAAGYAGAGVEHRVYPFFEAMEELYAEADVVLCRAGATTFSEVAAFGLPSIMVPFPFAKDNHQDLNAEVMARAGGALKADEKDLDGPKLGGMISELASDGDRLARMARCAGKIAIPDAAARVAGRVIGLASGGKA